MRPSEVNVTEGGVVEICVEFAEGQMAAERLVTLFVAEAPSMSFYNYYCTTKVMDE